MEIKVNPSVLIPRPETELLVETIITENNSGKALKILDIGTGSGNISIALAKNINDCFITSIDVSKKALETASGNAVLNDVSDKINFKNIDVFEQEIYNLEEFDIIVSNPPYVEKDEMKNLQKEIVNYEPHNAVTDGADGYKFYRKISQLTSKLLKQRGKLYFEVGIGQSQKVSEIMSENNFGDIKIIKDYQEIDRVVYGIKI